MAAVAIVATVAYCDEKPTSSSCWASFTIYAKESEDGAVMAYDMALACDHTWRGLIPMRSALEDGLYVRIAGRNRQSAGGEGYNPEIARYSLVGNVSSLPVSDLLEVKADDDSWTWVAVPCDGMSEYMLVQLRDDTLAYTIVHAEFQDFNGWVDACRDDGRGLFVGSSADTSSASGNMVFMSHFDSWKESTATNIYWNECFYAVKAELDYGIWPLYQPFVSSVSPNTGFVVGPGQLVNGYYRDNNTGMALQMEGKGKGYIQLVDAAHSPRGIESISFRARVAQSIDFDDFCYLMGDPMSMSNYTFMTAASFDVNGRTKFAGNASLSLVALHTPGLGCYELRVEQENASISAVGVVSPGNTFRISLYRWAYDGEMEEVAPQLLGTTMHANGSSMFNTTGENGNYARLFISVDTSIAGETRVVGGVARNSVGCSRFFDSASYREVMIRDIASNRHTYGSYGLLSANCPAHFVQPSYSSSPIAYPSYAVARNGFQFGNYTLAPIPLSS